MTAPALEVARAALEAAEMRTGVRSAVMPTPDLDTSPRPLGAMLPDGRLPLGTASVVAGSTSLLLALLSTSQRTDDWVAFVGMTDLGLLAAAEAGVALERTVVIPDVHLQGAETIAALLDGITYVVVGQGVPLIPSDRRRLLARARDRGTALVSVSAWEQAGLRLAATQTRWSGPDRGDYYLRRCEIDVEDSSRGAPKKWRVTLPIPGDGFTPGVEGSVRPLVAEQRPRLHLVG